MLQSLSWFVMHTSAFFSYPPFAESVQGKYLFEQEFFFPRKSAKPLQGCRSYLALVDIPADRGCGRTLKSALCLRSQMQKMLYEASCCSLHGRRRTITEWILYLWGPSERVLGVTWLLLDCGSSVAWRLQIPLWCRSRWLQRCPMPWSSLFGTSPSHAIQLRKKKTSGNFFFFKVAFWVDFIHAAVLCQPSLLCCFLLFSVQAWGRGSCLRVEEKENTQGLLACLFLTCPSPRGCVRPVLASWSLHMKVFPALPWSSMKAKE